MQKYAPLDRGLPYPCEPDPSDLRIGFGAQQQQPDQPDQRDSCEQQPDQPDQRDACEQQPRIKEAAPEPADPLEQLGFTKAQIARARAHAGAPDDSVVVQYILDNS